MKRFAVTSWRRDGSPVLPDAAMDWARSTRKTFVKHEAVAAPASFQDFAKLLLDNLEASGVGKGRLDLVRAVSAGLAREGITDMRSDLFATRVRKWLTGLRTGWSFKADAPNRFRNAKPLASATRNKLLIICRQVTGLAVLKRKLVHDPLAELNTFAEAKTIKPLFSIAELRRMVSDEARDHAATERAEIERALDDHGGPRGAAVKALALQRGVHWTTIYNALKRPSEPDPWWLACCVLTFTGCRAQEGMHLRWEWIRWQENIITLKLADDYDQKTDTERLIPLELELADILRPIAKPAGHILPPEIRAGGSGVRRSETEGKGAGDYSGAFARYLHRIGMDIGDRSAHSLRHCYISMKMARADTNPDRLRKAVGHSTITTTLGYARFSQLFESEVDSWPDRSLWLRRPVPATNTSASGAPSQKVEP